MKRALLAMVVVVAGCTPVEQRPDAPIEQLKPIKLTKAQIAAVKAGVTENLKDPESARFGDMVAGKDSKGGIMVCGYVNAKNSYGGYTGKEPFNGTLISNAAFLPAGIGGNEYETRAIISVCARRGLYL